MARQLMQYYNRAMTIQDVNELANALVSRLEKLFDI